MPVVKQAPLTPLGIQFAEYLRQKLPDLYIVSDVWQQGDEEPESRILVIPGKGTSGDFSATFRQQIPVRIDSESLNDGNAEDQAYRIFDAMSITGGCWLPEIPEKSIPQKRIDNIGPTSQPFPVAKNGRYFVYQLLLKLDFFNLTEGGS